MANLAMHARRSAVKIHPGRCEHRMDVVMADMASIGLMGFLTDRILLLIESRALQWKQRSGS